MSKERAEIGGSLNEKVIFDSKIAKQTTDLILRTESYVVNFDKPKEDWIKLPDGNIIPCYCNCRYINRDPVATRIIGDNLSEMIKSKFSETELIVGLETAGISWASRVALDLQLPFAYARGKAKGYGLGKLIECNPPKNLKTVIIDDVFFTGESVIKAVETLNDELQANVLGVGVITNLSNLENNENYSNLSNSRVSLYSLTDYSFILNELRERKQIDNKELLELGQFYNNPKRFSWC